MGFNSGFKGLKAFHNYPTFGRKVVFFYQDDKLSAKADTRNPGVKQVI